MRIVKYLGIFEHTLEYDYTPAPAELHYWYSGTHAGSDRHNPYVRHYGAVASREYQRRVAAPPQPTSGESGKDGG